VAGRATDQLLIRSLDRQEAREGGLTGGIRMVDLGQPAVGALDLVERRPTGEPERPIRIGVEGHDACRSTLGRSIASAVVNR
jgi:hypothetical protein